MKFTSFPSCLINRNEQSGSITGTGNFNQQPAEFHVLSRIKFKLKLAINFKVEKTAVIFASAS